jgi:hypothetical protein
MRMIEQNTIEIGLRRRYPRGLGWNLEAKHEGEV